MQCIFGDGSDPRRCLWRARSLHSRRCLASTVYEARRCLSLSLRLAKRLPLLSVVGGLSSTPCYARDNNCIASRFPSRYLVVRTARIFSIKLDALRNQGKRTWPGSHSSVSVRLLSRERLCSPAHRPGNIQYACNGDRYIALSCFTKGKPCADGTLCSPGKSLPLASNVQHSSSLESHTTLRYRWQRRRIKYSYRTPSPGHSHFSRTGQS